MSRELSNEEMNEVLLSQNVGHLGVADGNVPYVIPMGYIYHDNVIYGQTTDGKKIDFLRKNPLACFQVERVEKHEWRSVVCWGKYEEIDFEDPLLKNSDAAAVARLLTMRLAEIQKTRGIDVPFVFQHGIQPLTIDGKTSRLSGLCLRRKLEG